MITFFVRSYAIKERRGNMAKKSKVAKERQRQEL